MSDWVSKKACCRKKEGLIDFNSFLLYHMLDLVLHDQSCKDYHLKCHPPKVEGGVKCSVNPSIYIYIYIYIHIYIYIYIYIMDFVIWSLFLFWWLRCNRTKVHCEWRMEKREQRCWRISVPRIMKKLPHGVHCQFFPSSPDSEMEYRE